MKKISYGQLIMLLLICRISRMITANPLKDTSGGIVMISVIIAGLIQVLMVIPIIVLYKRTENQSVCEVAFAKSKILGKALFGLYAVFFMIVALRAVRYFTFFMTETFPSINSPRFISLSIILVSIYVAVLGIEPIARTSTIVMVAFFIMLIIIRITSQNTMSIINVNLVSDNMTKSFIEVILKEIGMNTELPAIALLLPFLKSGIIKATYGFLAIKAVIINIIVFIYTSYLGEFVRITYLPLFAVGAYSKTRLFERFDAVYMVEWTLCAIVAVGFYLFIAAHSVRNIVSRVKQKYLSIGWGVILAIVVVVTYKSHSEFDHVVDKWVSPPVVVLLTTVVPLIVMLTCTKKPNKKLKRV